MTSWHSYPKIWAMGHAQLKELLFDPVLIEEKIDGSQFSFGVFGGEVKMRSKGQELIPGKEKMFSLAERFVEENVHLLKNGWTYRAEYLRTPKHNTLAYSRVPKNHLIVFDINMNQEEYLGVHEKRDEAARIGLECVPVLGCGEIQNVAELLGLLDLESSLGGPKIEGFVIKNYARFGNDKKALMGKYVSEAFKEKHATEWKVGNPTQNDIVERMVTTYKTDARWEKAIQHLRDCGKLEGSPKDIGLLLKEVGVDILAECGDEIRDHLWKWAWPKIQRGLTRGLPEFYKEKLLMSQEVKTE